MMTVDAANAQIRCWPTTLLASMLIDVHEASPGGVA